MDTSPELIAFILAAKKSTYAGGGVHAPSCRPASVDLPFQQGDYTYLDTYLGGYTFIGEEAVWHKGVPVWGMNYYGTMTVPEIPEGFNQFLKDALLRVPAEAPFRGPRHHADDRFIFNCQWHGAPNLFHGEEAVYFDKTLIYRLFFHGGAIS